MDDKVADGVPVGVASDAVAVLHVLVTDFHGFSWCDLLLYSCTKNHK